MGRDLAPYRVLRGFREGGQGRVLLALDTRLQRRVCIKIYPYEGGLRSRLRLQREAWRLAKLECARLCDVLDVVAHGGRLALVTRYVPGCSLEQLLSCEDRLPAADAVALTSDLASALGALRLAGFVHGDVSAANVIVGDDSRAVLIDLGAAVYSGTRPEAGSEFALSPEQLRGAEIDARSDTFALGLLLYRMLTGAHPFEQEGRVDRQKLLLGLQERPRLAATPASARGLLQDLLLDLLAPQPEHRPPAGATLQDRLRAIRVQLPAPGDLGARALAAGRSSPEQSTVAALPASLRRLPLPRRLADGLLELWHQRSVRARGFIVLLLLGAPLFAGIYASRPGQCIAVEAPYIEPGARRLLAGSNPGALHESLTTMVKRQAGRAMVLGRGVDSDSRLTVSEGGLRDVCIAKRRLSLALSCESEDCLVELVGHRLIDESRQTFELPASAPGEELRAGIERLVEAQLSYLLD
ncbi:MAG: serine/threonine-protein kinase [Pseudomonadota bacterium]